MTTLRLSIAFLALMATSGLPLQAQGKVPLAEEAHINAQLVAGAAGDMLRKTCPTLSARMLVVWKKLRELEAYARAQGYTEAEVDAFFKDRAQKSRIRDEAKAYLAEAGVVEGEVETYCAAGRAEIDKGTLVGALLRASE